MRFRHTVSGDAALILPEPPRNAGRLFPRASCDRELATAARVISDGDRAWTALDSDSGGRAC